MLDVEMLHSQMLILGFQCWLNLVALHHFSILRSTFHKLHLQNDIEKTLFFAVFSARNFAFTLDFHVTPLETPFHNKIQSVTSWLFPERTTFAEKKSLAMEESPKDSETTSYKVPLSRRSSFCFSNPRKSENLFETFERILLHFRDFFATSWKFREPKLFEVFWKCFYKFENFLCFWNKVFQKVKLCFCDLKILPNTGLF